MRMKPSVLAIAAAIVVAFSLSADAAEKKYGPGVTDAEIKIGQTMPYSGPASSAGTTPAPRRPRTAPWVGSKPPISK